MAVVITTSPVVTLSVLFCFVFATLSKPCASVCVQASEPHTCSVTFLCTRVCVCVCDLQFALCSARCESMQGAYPGKFLSKNPFYRTYGSALLLVFAFLGSYAGILGLHVLAF